MTSSANPTLWIIAGANGVGKTTFALSEIVAISGSASFVNLDLIAQGISPLDPSLEPLRAGRIALAMMRDLVARRETFSIETTLAGRGHKGLISVARENAYVLSLRTIKSLQRSVMAPRHLHRYQAEQ